MSVPGWLSAQRRRDCARLLAFALGALALGPLPFGCGSSEPAAATDGSTRSVVLGTGEAEFEDMDGEPRIGLVHGAQGGFHVWASFLAYGFESQGLDLTLTTTVDGAAEGLVMHARITTRELTDADGNPARSFAGFPAQVRDARCADGRRVQILLHVSEPDGSGSAEDTRACIAELAEEYRTTECP